MRIPPETEIYGKTNISGQGFNPGNLSANPGPRKPHDTGRWFCSNTMKHQGLETGGQVKLNFKPGMAAETTES